MFAGTLAITTSVYGGRSKEDKTRSQEYKNHAEKRPRLPGTSSHHNTNNDPHVSMPLDFFQQLATRMQEIENQLKQISRFNNPINTTNTRRPPLQAPQNPLNGTPTIQPLSQQQMVRFSVPTRRQSITVVAPKTSMHRTTSPIRRHVERTGRIFLEKNGFTIAKDHSKNILELIKTYAAKYKEVEEIDKFMGQVNKKGKVKFLTEASMFLNCPIIYLTNTSVYLYNKREPHQDTSSTTLKKFNNYFRENSNAIIILLEDSKYYIVTPSENSITEDANFKNSGQSISENIELSLRTFDQSNQVAAQNQLSFGNPSNKPAIEQPQSTSNTKNQENKLPISLTAKTTIQLPNIQKPTTLEHPNKTYNDLKRSRFVINKREYTSFYDALKSIKSLNINEEDFEEFRYEVQGYNNGSANYIIQTAGFFNITIVVFCEHKNYPVSVFNKGGEMRHETNNSVEKFLEVTTSFNDMFFIYKNTEKPYQTVTPPHK